MKLFGYARSWRAIYAGERAALAAVATDPGIAAPGLLGEGQLYQDDPAPWPYLITSRTPGVASWRAALSEEQRRSLAVDVGRQVHRIHALPTSGVAADEAWSGLDVVGAARQSSLPAHLVGQIDGYLARLGPFDRVFVHGDLVANHAYVENGRLSGIIDWGDAVAADRHFEIIQVFRDLFDCDKSLLRVFLDASAWPVREDFPRQAMGLALYRQAVMLALHHGGDVFEPIAARFPLEDIATLDDLAIELFSV